MWDIMYKVNKKMNYVNFLLAICFNMVYKTFIRGVAQPGRVLGLGPRCRMFESCRPDQYQKAEVYTFAFFVIHFPCTALGQPTVKK